tara:strand:- start:1100 stop:1891 length:792 start_codon:yes stop_codon:yes gene_type:complete
MAKKKKEEVSLEETPTIKKQETKKDSWEVKDRTYLLKYGLSPLTYTIKSRGVYYWDEEKGYERELKYTENQKTPFVDEFKGDARLAHITFEDGVLSVSKNQQTLQKFLHYSPDNGKVYEEFDSVQVATDDLVDIELEIQALNAARDIEIDHAEAVLRVESGSKVSEMTSKEIKRDVLVFAKKNPQLFLDLVQDENVELRNVGIKAVEARILTLSSDNRTFNWASNNRKVMTVPFEEHPYSALAAFFKTDEGLEIYNSILKRLN